MSQIEELHRRIVAAMDRIGTGVDALRDTAPVGGGADDTLRAALDDERVANAQLEERLKSLKERHEQEVDAMRADMESLRTAPVDDPEKAALREQLTEATARLASVEAARAELADAKAALESQDELDALKSENAELKIALEAAQEIEAENGRLRSELADSERVAELSSELDMLRAERASHGAAMSRLDDDLQRMRKANEQLRQSVDELRAATEGGVPDAALLNRATVAELEATRAAQATDAAEAHAVLARLEPLLSKAKLAEGEVE
ncbi:chromosome segregation protein [Ruegeria denitrificans]|uniref:Chromosome segregation protein n=1 Tax=Ruegeria denitrificans TaxID=1715692 RepID=A0A0P1I810_9RHOB|nr:hypothetical protein [Ruegeria denitrificans]CUJ96475.1 chromosome segregation protein [Ruegeria denitrificans]